MLEEKKHQQASMPSIIDLIESGVGIEHFKKDAKNKEQQEHGEDDQYLMVDESLDDQV